MTLSDLVFDLPQELIAQTPAEPRDSARLLKYVRATGAISHHHISDLPDLLPAHTLLVANDSKVRHARLKAQTEGSEKNVEILVLEPITPAGHFTCMLRGRNLVMGTRFKIRGSTCRAEIISIEPNEQMTTYTLRFEGSVDVESVFEQVGELPLPPYITERTSTPDRYQTVFSEKIGSAAAPTAGLHFTPQLIERLKHEGFGWETVTLQVGMGTFLPLRKEAVHENVLHTEHTFISEKTAEIITTTKTAGHPVLAVGTTATRTLESHTHDGTVHSGELATNLFIQPGYSFKTVDALLTNFHLPKSSLLVLLSAFLNPSEKEGLAALHTVYETAIRERYRFYSFGDALLVL